MSKTRSSLEHGNRESRALGVMVTLLVLILLAVAGTVAKEISDTRHAAGARAAITNTLREEVKCIATWADTFSARVEQQSSADRERLAALDSLVRALQHGNRMTWVRAMHAYLTASDRYNQQIRTHPLPAAPKFLCDELDSTVLPPPGTVTVRPSSHIRTMTNTVTQTPGPSPHPTVTVTVPGPTVTVHSTRTVIKPGPTVTVRRPGPTVTVTRTCLPGLPGLPPVLCR